MSHTVKIESVNITSEASLRAALKELIDKHGVKGSIKTNAIPKFPNGYGVGYDGKPCDLVLSIDDYSMDVGFRKEGNKYEIITDDLFKYKPLAGSGKFSEYDQRVKNSLGKLLQTYQKHQALRSAKANGYTVESCTYDKDGTLKMVLNVGE